MPAIPLGRNIKVADETVHIKFKGGSEQMAFDWHWLIGGTLKVMGLDEII